MLHELDTTEAYQTMLTYVLNEPEFESSPRGMKTREILNLSVKILNPSSDPITTADEKRNIIIANYTKKEFDWYLSGNRKAESAPTKFWQTIADEEGNVNSNYGDLVLYDKSENGMTPFEWTKRCLVSDKDSRKAIMRFNKPKHCLGESKDFVCTMYMVFHIRNNELHAIARMRSADLFTGPVYDLPWFCYLQEKMLKELKPVYNDLKMGTLVFSADSLHIYERNFEQVEGMIR